MLQSGQNFFDGWEFFTAADPTNGASECSIALIDSLIDADRL
jgi:hypothetical protein